MEFTTLTYDKDRYVGRLTLNRPRLLNAVNYQGAVDLGRAAEAIRDDTELRVVLVRGAGRAFCTGIDLKELSSGHLPPAYFEVWDRALRVLECADKVIICAIHGYALGGGLQLSLACDIRIATEDCLMGLPAVKEGLIPGLGTYRLQRHIGMGRAKWMVLSGENIDGKRAHEFGSVDYLVKGEAFDDQVESLVQTYLKLSTQGARQSKVLMGMSADLDTEAFFQEYLRRQETALSSAEYAEAMLAYREKREPRFLAE